MRPFKMRQTIAWKCPFCGGKNKQVGDLLHNGVKRGESVKCCNCGHIDNFVGYELNYNHIINKDLDYTNRRCVQEKYCQFKDCDLYGTCKKGKKPPLEVDKKPSNGNSDIPELLVKPDGGPRFL